ncbi:MAG: hypothetical protein IK076_00640, partial [Bacteroidales bacterium]|nr:hypothetical protein [Bacteroidales bacterium]
MKHFTFLLSALAAAVAAFLAPESLSYAQDNKNVKHLESPYYVFPRMGAQHVDLSSGWELTACDSLLNDPSMLEGKEWLTVESPTSVQMAYHKAGKYPHPYINLNSEKYYRQLEQKVHYYRKSFPTPPVRDTDYVILSFDGIDYTARIWVNGNLLGQHEGMYGGPTVKINQYLKKDGSDNVVVVEVRSANYQFPDFKPFTPKTYIHTWFFSHGNVHVTPCFHVGMWNSVRLDILPYYHLERPFLSTRSIADGKAVLDFSVEIFSGKNSKDYSLHRWNNHQASSLARKIRYSDDDVT